jgi:hypothetical protein
MNGIGWRPFPWSPTNAVCLPYTLVASPDMPKKAPTELAMWTAGDFPFMNAKALKVCRLRA